MRRVWVQSASKFFLAAVLALALSGCALTGGNSGSKTASGSPSPSPTPNTGPADLTPINHIIFMAQENRSFDSYFGHLNDYRATLGLPQIVDGTPAGASNPADDGSTIPAFHFHTTCIENTSAAWTTSHINFNRFDQSGNTPTMDGFVVEAAAAAKFQGSPDIIGVRAMGYYTADDLISHYFLATQFATSDRWFAPAPVETLPNRMYLVAATSHGHAHTPATPVVGVNTIFDLLDQKGITWKIYYADPLQDTELNFFAGFVAKHPSGIVPLAQYFADLQSGSLPQVAYIDPGFEIGADEHPGTGNNIQTGTAFSTNIITSLMNSTAWKDSVFFLTFDEHGGFYDHVPSPTNIVSPDGIPPQDLFGGVPPDSAGDFTRFGFRVPLLVVSPFTKPHYVSHTLGDSTAILKFIEKRFGLPSLTQRDATAMDMSEFLDIAGAAWKVPPSVPVQPVDLTRCTTTLP
jgi:phospholipase C